MKSSKTTVLVITSLFVGIPLLMIPTLAESNHIFATVFLAIILYGFILSLVILHLFGNKNGLKKKV